MVVIFDSELRAFGRSEVRWMDTSSGTNDEIGILVLDPQDELLCGPDGYGARKD